MTDMIASAISNLAPIGQASYKPKQQMLQRWGRDRAGLGRGSRCKFREHILASYSYGFELMVIVAENKLLLARIMESNDGI